MKKKWWKSSKILAKWKKLKSLKCAAHLVYELNQLLNSFVVCERGVDFEASGRIWMKMRIQVLEKVF